ncbi:MULTISPECIES: hypothetical protein [Nostoc]|uniref:DUF4189 domain-containing protein n=1 Tax=Nostoc paludosum FACHB-159 TaxID=2692908 RepID=A0ABR8KEF9_9NOSO|nr:MULTISPECIES: hypothetical protein [Nostoc]MBD2680813.1 hypothetical protein [Nostoc sp. FACHB-857]MBD2736568.1 hypothetical protein [Nostoc paludosum FACHB-159]
MLKRNWLYISGLTISTVLIGSALINSQNKAQASLTVLDKLSYCSASSGQGDWISWGHQTAVDACGIVNQKFASWGQRIVAREYGRYYVNEINIVEVSCLKSQPFSVGGRGTEAFNKGVEIVRLRGQEGRCIYRVTNVR